MLQDVSKWLRSFVDLIKWGAPWLVSQEHDNSHQMEQNHYPGIDTRMAELKQRRTGRCLLSLDGGGIRGFSQIFILEEIANRIKHDLGLAELPRLCDYFDMIGGVGTGGYLAILVGRLGLTEPQLKQEFTELLAQAMAGPMAPTQLDYFLKAVVKRYTGDSETLMFDPHSLTHHCKTFVGSITAGSVGYLTKFRSYEVREGMSFNCPIWQAARATLALPNLFPNVTIGPDLLQQVYISGEVGWKNPSNEVIREFEAYWPGQNIACLASVGAGHEGIIEINGSIGPASLNMAMERIAMDCERVAQEVGYRFEGRNTYFRLSVEQGLQKNTPHKPLTLDKIDTHTKAYLRSPGVTVSVNRLVASLLHAIEVSPWTTTRDHFDQSLKEYISGSMECVDRIPIEEVKLAAEEIVLTLELIRGVKSNEDRWLILAKMINDHFSTIGQNTVVKFRESFLTKPLWRSTKAYFAELKIVRMNLQELLKLHPHQIWGPPTHEDFLSRCLAALDECFKRLQGTVVNEMYSQVVLAQEDKRLEELLSWLSPLDLNRRHSDVRVRRSEGTGKWFINTAEFQTWFVNQSPEGCRALCSFGAPGAGKTVICSLTIDHLLEAVDDNKTGVAYLYCDYRDQDGQNIVSMIGGLTKQLLKQTSAIPSNIWEIFKKNSHQVITIEDIKQIFTHTLQNFDSILICIDALDECELQARTHLLQFLNTPHQTPLRVFLTGRYNIEVEVSKALANLSPKSVPITANKDDIQIFLVEKIALDPDQEAMDNKLKEEIIEKIVSLSQGIFLLPILQIQAVLEQVTKSDRRLALTTIPTRLFDIYSVTLERIRQQSKSRAQLAFSVLTWVYLSERQLHINELQHALAVRPGHTAFDTDGMPSEKVLMGCCLGLVVVEAGTSTIRLTHFTLQEYLDEKWMELFPSGHSVIAEICLTYLNFDHKGESLREMRTTSPLLDYTTHYVGHHLRKGSNPILDQQMITTLHKEKKFQLLAEASTHTLYLWPFPIIPLHWSAHFGLASVVNLLLLSTNNEVVNAKNHAYGRTALSYAAENGHEVVVQQLLNTQGVDTNSMDGFGRTPLSYAAGNNHKAIVQTFLSTGGIEINPTDKNGQTPLSHAAENGHEPIVQLLLNTGVDVNPIDKNGQTPLSYAARKGYEAIVQFLLRREGVKINLTDNNGRTPLSYAAENGHSTIVQSLLSTEGIKANSRCSRYGWTALFYAAEKGYTAIIQLLLSAEGIKVNLTDNNGQTILSYAAIKGYETMVQILLNTKGVDINPIDGFGRTPLSYAAANNHKTITQILLCTEGVAINPTDKNGWTPLSYATENGHEAIVQLLANTEGVNINPKDRNGQTPLSYATEKGYGAVVQSLLSIEGIDVNPIDKDGQTPLSYAARKGYDQIVQILLSMEGIEVNPTDKNGQTPLSYAAENGHNAIVQILLGTEGVDINPMDKDGQTPLSYAAGNGYEAIVQLLLSKKGININPIDKNKQTPLAYAAKRGYEAITQLLLNTSGVDINPIDKNGQTPLSYATWNGHVAIFQLFLSTEGVNINPIDNNGQTPLSYAAKNGHKVIFQHLLRTEGVLVNLTDKNGQTPLSHATGNNHEAIVQILLSTEGVDINPTDKNGQTPLSYAAENGYEAMVQLLLSKEGININPADKNGQTPLFYAARKGYDTIVQILLGMKDVEVSLIDKNKQTPLSYAAGKGHGAIVQSLLATENIKVNLKCGRYGQTALSYAAEKGHKAIVQILLNTKHVDIDSKDNFKRTPLSRAAEGSGKYADSLKHADAASIVQLLLCQPSVDPNSKDSGDRTPLSYAAEVGNMAVVKLLLKQNIDINQKDANGQTALSYAMKSRWRHYGELEKLLIEYGASNTPASALSLLADSSDISEVESEDLGHNHRGMVRIHVTEPKLESKEMTDEEW